MTPDKKTLSWIGTLMGAQKTIRVQSVGDGPYGLMEVINCGGIQERHWRFIGFATAQAAQDCSLFLTAAKAARPGELERGDPHYADEREGIQKHATEHVSWDVFCTNIAIPDTLLESLIKNDK